MLIRRGDKLIMMDEKREEAIIRMAMHRSIRGIGLTFYTYNLLSRSHNNECEMLSANSYPKLKIESPDGTVYRYPIVYCN